MEALYRSCCGIDVHKQFLVACLLVLDEKGRPHQELRRFSTMTPELLSCVDWLKAAQCQAIAMESTGVYWKSPFNLMEGHFEQVMIVNAEHLKQVPGRKTDKKDAEWDDTSPYDAGSSAKLMIRRRGVLKRFGADFRRNKHISESAPIAYSLALLLSTSEQY